MFSVAASPAQAHLTSPGGLLEQPGADNDHAGQDNIRDTEAIPGRHQTARRSTVIVWQGLYAVHTQIFKFLWDAYFCGFKIL